MTTAIRNMLQCPVSNASQHNPSTNKLSQFANIVVPMIIESDDSGTPIQNKVETSSQNKNRNNCVHKEQDTIFTIQHPNEFDVLAGRGNGVAFHSGNHNFVKLVKQYYGIYSDPTSSRNQKMAITEEIIRKIHSSGGRFLKPNRSNNSRDCWICMTSDETRKKTGQALRDGGKPAKKRHLRSLHKKGQLMKKEEENELAPNSSLSNSKSIVLVHDTNKTSTEPVNEDLQDDNKNNIGSKNTSIVNMNFHGEVNCDMFISFKKEINRIRCEMDLYKSKYEQLDQEKRELTRSFMNQVVGAGGGLHATDGL